MVPPLTGTIVEEDSDGAWWQAEGIVDDRVHRGRKEYRVRWVGCTKRQDTWEGEEDLADSLFEEYKEQRKKASNKRKNESNKTKKRKKPKIGSKFTPTSRDSATFLSFGTLSITTLCSRPDHNMVSFASWYFSNRLITLEVPMKRRTTAPPRETKFGAYTLNLLSSRVPNDSAASKNYRNRKSIRFTYVATSGPGLEDLDLDAELCSIANFDGLPSPHKAKSRLELLESGANAVFTEVSLKDFKLVDEDFHLGCGFIPTTMLEAMEYEPNICIQVRVISPQLGVFKGVLCPKLGIQHIELPRSMQKVGPSKVRPCKGWVVVVVKNSFPTEKNIQLGRQFLGARSVAKPVLSVFNRNRGPGKMIERLWRSMGVSQSSFCSYVERCNEEASIAGLKHAYLLGVKDPSGLLPKGTVFIPGISKALSGNVIFLTRSPCIEPSDGRLVPVTTKKPSRMSANEWKWLNSLPFGVVIFASPRRNTPPLPELIAGGDLDGDTYLACWDSILLKSMNMTSTSPDSKCKLVQSSSSPEEAENWLSAAQNVMLDIEWSLNVNLLHGKLWGASKEAADKNDAEFMNDKDAVQLAQAFKLSLDLGKTGGLLCVPKSVRSVIPKSLHSTLSSLPA